VQRNLGSDSLQRWLVDTLPAELETTRAASDKGFRVLRVHRAASGTGS
jgi:16S rRNA (guanine1207-N2)-methyltransferase